MNDIRERLARALHRADVEPRRFDRHWNVHEWDEISEEAREYWRRLAGALMPIVERVAREVLHDAITAATFDGLGSVDADAIVRRVMGDE